MSLPKSKTVNVELYVGGISKAQNMKNLVKLSANESALGPSPNVLNMFREKLDLKKYPDGKSENLKGKKLGYKFKPSWLHRFSNDL